MLNKSLIKEIKKIQVGGKSEIKKEIFGRQTFLELYEKDQELAKTYLKEIIRKNTIKFNWLLIQNRLSEEFLLFITDEFGFQRTNWYLISKYQNLSFNFLMENIEYFNKYNFSEEVLRNNRVLSESTKTKFFNYLKLLN
jgi:hypothetical protein